MMILGDIKRISRGLGKNRYGNINLWGFEDPPTLEEKPEQTERELHYIQTMLDEFNELDDLDKFVKLKELVKLITDRIRNVRCLQVSKMKKLEKYEKASSSTQNYKYVKSAAKTFIYDCKVFVKSALSINGRICELLSSLHGNWHLLKTSTLYLSNCENVKCLQSTSYISRYIDLNVNTHLVKQKSDEWFELHKKCFVTASTIYNALGFHGWKELNMQFQWICLQKNKRRFDELTPKKNSIMVLKMR